jgi:hypothetical protein
MLIFFLFATLLSDKIPLPPGDRITGTDACKPKRVCMNIIDKTDEELEAVAFPMWEDLIKYSNKGQYGKFILNFSYDLLLGLNEIELGKQFAKSELTRNLMKEYDFFGFIRRGEHVTCLFRVRSTKKEGEWLGRMVIGYERGEVKIFAASIF